MDEQEKAYIDKKFSELENKLINPDPKELMDRTKRYGSLYYKIYWKWLVIGLLLVVLSMLLSFRWVGLF